MDPLIDGQRHEHNNTCDRVLVHRVEDAHHEEADGLHDLTDRAFAHFVEIRISDGEKCSINEAHAGQKESDSPVFGVTHLKQT